ncbi:hypothetical protein V6R21_24050 [Limibacter armeniacum]|uniref:hypothetical protein n=1 Tax=Limibacter armeniacum TaxID=466084 RepID=UPI002FE607D4
MLSLEKDLHSQLFELTEDILQVYYNSDNQDYCIDIGWYPENFEITDNSYFRVRIIRNEDWEKLIYDEYAKSISGLKDLIQDAIKICTNS